MSRSIKMNSAQWIMAGIKDGSLILEDTGTIRINASAFSKDMPVLVKKAQSSFSAGEAAMYGVPGGIASGMKGTGLGNMTYGPTPYHTTSKLTDLVGRSSPRTTQLLGARQGFEVASGGSITGLTPQTAGVRMGLNQPFSAARSAYSVAKGSGSGRVMSGLKAVAPGVKAIPGGVSTAAKGLAGAAASGGVRGFLAGNFISAAGSVAAWGIHHGVMATWDWARGANDMGGALRTPQGSKNFAKAQQVLSEKVMPLMYGQAAGPNAKLEKLNSYITELAKQTESDAGYQAALSGQIEQAMQPEEAGNSLGITEDLSTPGAGAGSFNPYNIQPQQ